MNLQHVQKNLDPNIYVNTFVYLVSRYILAYYHFMNKLHCLHFHVQKPLTFRIDPKAIKMLSITKAKGRKNFHILSSQFETEIRRHQLNHSVCASNIAAYF